MSQKNSARCCARWIEVEASFLIPLSLLAQMPEKLHVLADEIKTASELIDASGKEYLDAHRKVSEAFANAKDLAKNAWNALSFLAAASRIETLPLEVIAASTFNQLSAIEAAGGNMQNHEYFKRTFVIVGMVEATEATLYAASNDIRKTIRLYGY